MELEIEFWDDKDGVVNDTELASIENAARQAGDGVQYITHATGVGAGLVLIGMAGISFLKRIVPQIFSWLRAKEHRSVSLKLGGVTIKAKGANCQESVLMILEALKPAGSERAQVPLQNPDLQANAPKQLPVSNKKKTRRKS